MKNNMNMRIQCFIKCQTTNITVDTDIKVCHTLLNAVIYKQKINFKT